MANLSRAHPNFVPQASRIGLRHRKRLCALVQLAGAHGPALVGYVGLTSVVYKKVASRPRSIAFSSPWDGAHFLWDMWRVPRTLARRKSIFATKDMFYPIGARTAFNPTNSVVAVLSAPLQKIFGLVATCNISQLGAVVSTGFATYLLAREAGAERLAAFFAGASVTFTSYRLVRISGHHNLNHTEILLFGLLALKRFLVKPSTARRTVLGLLGGVTFLNEPTYGFFFALSAVIAIFDSFGFGLTSRTVVLLVQSGCIALLTAAPLLVAMIRDARRDHFDQLPGWGGADAYSADLLSWLVPPLNRRYLPDCFPSLASRVSTGERAIFPGWLTTGLAICGAMTSGAGMRRVMDQKFWIKHGCAFALLASGPFLQFNGRQGTRSQRHGARYAVPMPYALLERIPLVRSVRTPSRFAFGTVVSMGVLAALALTDLSEQLGRLGVVVALLAIPIAVAETLPETLWTVPAAVPAAYESIAIDRGRGAVLEIPLQWYTGFGQYGDGEGSHQIFMYYGTIHGKPMVTGNSARFPQQDLDRLLHIPVYDQLLGMLPRQGPENVASVPAGRSLGEVYPAATFSIADLQELGIGDIVDHRDIPRPAAMMYISELELPILVDDGTVVVYKVPDL
jgi:hypothetical protein